MCFNLLKRGNSGFEGYVRCSLVVFIYKPKDTERCKINKKCAHAPMQVRANY